MKINFTNISNIISKLQTSQKTHENKGSESSNANISKSNKQEQALSTNTYTNSNIQIAKLSSEQKTLLLKELLNLPSDLKDFLELFSKSGKSRDISLALLQKANVEIDLADIKQLLDTNSKEIINKLIKLIQQPSSNYQGISQIKDILSALNQVLPQGKTQNYDTLKSIILLYLPWLPLTPPQDIKFCAENKEKAESEETDELIMILISTINLGKLRITLFLDAASKLKLDLELQERKELGDDFEKKLLEKITNDISGLGMLPEAETNFRHSKNLTENTDKQRAVSFQKVSKISPPLMMAAYTIIKLVFEVDENFSLKHKRKEILGD